LLLAHVLGTRPEALLRDPEAPAEMARLVPLLARRQAHEPLALILGRREFWSLEFAVSPATLIPRPESETLIEAAVAGFADRQPPRLILDLGTGSGCLLLAALSEFAAAFGVGVDRSAAAVTLAAHNAAAMGLADRARFVCGNWADALDARFDLVLCNPPYISRRDLDGLMPDVACYESRTALDGGVDGFDAYRCLLPALRLLLTAQGLAVLELGAGQADTVALWGRETGFIPELRADLAGLPRALTLRVPRP
jgi:release factor glutamine methyltransferase